MFLSKYTLLLFFFLGFQLNFAQSIISGKILSKNNQALEGASVYFNNTTIGTISKNDGTFELKAKPGNYLLIVSFLGYKTEKIQIIISTENDFLEIKLNEDNTLLDEVIVKKVIFDDDWKYNLNRFKKTLFGRSELANDCVILNEKKLRFDYNYKTNTLTAYNIEPLKIKHKSLGYLINYDIVEYTLTQKHLFFSGYIKYTDLQTPIKPKWIKNRLKTFNGSRMHFLRSIIHKKLTEEGFLVSQFKRVPNKKRPADSVIKKARRLLSKIRKQIKSSKKTPFLSFKFDSLKRITKKSSLKKFKDSIYQLKVPYHDMILSNNKTSLLDFNDYLLVTYTKEPEEENYLIKPFGQKRRPTGMQSSNIILNERKTIIDPAGVMVNPNALINQGYWAFESFANMLPLDYQPPKN